jgi:hypothetical protein
MISISDSVENVCLLSCIKVQNPPSQQAFCTPVSISYSVENVCLLSCIKVQNPPSQQAFCTPSKN